ncbi:MAG: hypothetical protein WA672_09475 [Candidatus Angelobacter sp.]
MPKFTLSDAQTDALATALLAETDRAATYPKELIISCTRSSNYHPGGDAGKLMDDLRCLSCHAINGNSGDMAPLRHIAGLASDEARDAHWNTVC